MSLKLESIIMITYIYCMRKLSNEYHHSAIFLVLVKKIKIGISRADIFYYNDALNRPLRIYFNKIKCIFDKKEWKMNYLPPVITLWYFD